MTTFGIRGTFLDFIDDPWRHVGRESESARFHAEADFVVLDCNGGPPALAWRQSLIVEDGEPPTLEQAADLLLGLMIVGDDRAIDQTWAMGRQVYRRGDPG